MILYPGLRMLLRNAWFYFCLLVSTPIFALLAIAFYWQKSGRGGAWSGQHWSRFLLWAGGVRWDADLGALPPPSKDKGLIFMANHLSQLDILLLYAVLRAYHPAYIAKESLFSIPLFGQAMWSAGHIPIDRSNQRKAMKSINAAIEAVEKGRSIIIFPEGTRNLHPEQLGEFKIGGMILALKCRRPVSPILLANSDSILPKGRLFFPAWPKRVRIKALPPMDSESYTLKDRDQFKKDLHTRMNQAYLELR